MEDEESIDFSAQKNISVYPSSLYSGETLYLETNFDGSSLTADIYNLNGVKVYSTNLASSVTSFGVTMPKGIYIVIVTDNITGDRISTEKIIIK
ncbi:MAG: T9SS type A sorting domain-containing protein [bacterium]